MTGAALTIVERKKFRPLLEFTGTDEMLEHVPRLRALEVVLSAVLLRHCRVLSVQPIAGRPVTFEILAIPFRSIIQRRYFGLV